MSEWILKEQDYNGNLVYLRADRWSLHIIVKHPEMAPFVKAIQEVVRAPNVVTEDSGGSVHLARLGAVKGKWKELYLEVVIRYNSSGDRTTGDIQTVYFNAMPPKGELKWYGKS